MLKDLGWTRKIKIQKADGNIINPSIEEKQDAIIALLQDIDANTDGLELKADTINLNTDELEAKAQEIIDTIGEETGVTVLSRLKDLWDKLVSYFGDGLAKVKIWDGTNVARVDEGNRLLVATPPPTAPPETTAVIRTEYGAVATIDDDEYIIPNGETLTLQRFSAGAEVDTTNGNVIELWYDPTGDGSAMTIIDVIFSSGTSYQHDLNAEYIGNGTRKIRMRRKRLSGGSKSMFGRWEGYY